MKKRLANWCQRLAAHLDPAATRAVDSNNQLGVSEPTQRVQPSDLLEDVFTRLRRLHFTPQHIIDVGANRGTWTRTALKFFPDAHVTMLEPQEQLRDHFQDLLKGNPKVHLHVCGASAADGELAFTIVDRDDSCNFSMTPEEASKLGYTQITMPVVAIDSLLRHGTLPSPDIIKIDAEGCDLEVLQGATESLKSCEVLFVEAAISCKTPSGTLMPNHLRAVINTVDEYGFTLFDFTDFNRTQKHDCLWLIEAVFIRKNGVIENQITSYV